jgi:hypothetical protein
VSFFELGLRRALPMRIEMLYFVQTCLLFLGDYFFFLFARIRAFHDGNAK